MQDGEESGRIQTVRSVLKEENLQDYIPGQKPSINKSDQLKKGIANIDHSKAPLN